MRKKALKYVAAALAVTTVMSMTACGTGSGTDSAAETTTDTAAATTEDTAAATAEDTSAAEETAETASAETTENTPEQQAKLDAMNIQKVDDYLYTCEIDDYDVDESELKMALKFKSEAQLEQAATELLEELDGLDGSVASGGCASVVNGDFYGRNYDWNYDDEAYFVIKTPAKEGRHAVLGVAGALKSITADVVDDGEWSDGYDSLACTTLDGINDAGLTANIHVVPTGEMGITTGTNPGADDLAAPRLVRAILDNCDSVDSAIEYINDHNIYCPNSLYMQQEFHWRIADSERSVIIELVNNEVKVLEDEPIATNFYLYNFDKTESELPEIAEGIERYNILKDNYDTATTKEGMIELMESINFSQAYDFNMVPFWYSEFSGRFDEDTYGTLTSAQFGDPDLSDGDLSKAGDYESIITWKSVINSYGRAKATDSYNSWITCYTSVYDMKNKTLTIVPQETGTEYEFSFDE